MSKLGKEKVDSIAFSDQASVVNEWMQQIREFRKIVDGQEEFPMHYFFDVRESVARIRLEGTHLEEEELFDLKRSLDTIHQMVQFLSKGADEEHFLYPALHALAEYVVTFPELVKRIDEILDKFGRIKDTASPELGNIRRELAKTEGSVSRTLNNILRSAQSEGLVEKDVTPTLRDGRLVIPVMPGMKRKIKGIVHDESASGKTVFIEPAEVVEANNRIRELEAEERREIIRILTEFAKQVRPHVRDILESFQFLAQIDLISAKAKMAELFKAYEPQVADKPHIDWIRAIHPLLELSLAKQGKQVVPLDIRLEEGRGILIISGPNAGGKSVCLKTVGLLQYMLQCGLSVPMGDRSTTGVFQNIMIDIGDEQSIENDLSTYSSHLTNMKQMMRHANSRTLLLIDEFGTGTEPQIGGAIAEAVLKQFWKRKTFGVITTHYQNLKHFADNHEGVINGAMLYDRHQMQALFQLQTGRPGSSFAIEIARKTGIPEEVISDATDIVGTDYIQSDKYLQDIVRDKRYWENKRQNIHQREKDMEKTISRYEGQLADVESQRKEILARARKQAEELLKETNRRIENTIKEIREKQAEKEETRRLREELQKFENEVVKGDERGVMSDEDFAKKLRQMEERKARKAQRKAKKEKQDQEAAEKLKAIGKGVKEEATLLVGDSVHIKGLTSVGTIESFDGQMATVIFGGMRTKMRKERLEKCNAKNDTTSPTPANKHQALQSQQLSRTTREAIDNRKLNFKQDIDVRGMRGDEAINAVTYFIDDAILVGMPRVRILHGTGSGILRQLIRQYLATIPNVTHFRDEHVQFGGHGITVVDLE